MKKLYLLIALLAASASAVSHGAPANDNFANRAPISVGTISLDIKSATVEAGELNTTQGHTVWYTYKAPSDCIITLDDTGTGFGNSFMSVYMGSSLNAMTAVRTKVNDYGNISVNRLSFPAKAGTVFQICFGRDRSSTSATLTLKVTLTTTPFIYAGTLYGPDAPLSPYVSNDYFQNRKTLVGDSVTAINYMRDAGVEAGEPETTSGHTVWYTWTATKDSIVTISDTGTNYGNNFIAVYMGNSINNLIGIVGDVNDYGNIITTSVAFKAKKGTTYQICSGKDRFSDSDNNFLQLNLSTVAFTYAGVLYGPEVPTAPTPKNDSFYTPQVLSGNLLTVIGSAISATTEAGENGIPRTLWYSWTATANKVVRVDFPPDTSGRFGAFTGTSPQTVVEVGNPAASSALSYGFNAVAGTTYKLLVGSAASTFQFTLTASDPPINHGPVSKITFPKNGQTVSVKGFTFKGTVNDADGDKVTAYQFMVNDKTVISYPSNTSLFSGKLKKGKLTLRMRSKDSKGKWGAYHTIKVTAK